jgi:hypothetical protein
MKIISDWKAQLKSYSFLSLLAIILSTLSWGGLAVLGVVSGYMSFWGLLTTASIFAVIGMVGKFIDQDLKNDGKMFWEESEISEENKNV